MTNRKPEIRCKSSLAFLDKGRQPLLTCANKVAYLIILHPTHLYTVPRMELDRVLYHVFWLFFIIHLSLCLSNQSVRQQL